MYPQALLVSGRVGHAYVFKQYGMHRSIGKYYYPYVTMGPAILASRQKFADAVTNWQGFNDPTKRYYNALKYPNIMSGYNRYIRFYMRS